MSDRLLFDSVPETPDADRYLERIGLDKRPTADWDGLVTVLQAHQRSVPFENIDVCDFGKALSLTPEDLFEKIVVKRRGGYCFELNGSFLYLLKSLGFEVTPCYCRSLRDGTLGGISHRGCLVYLDGKTYFTDVGYGNIMSGIPLLMEDGSVTSDGKALFTIKHYAGSWYEMIGDCPCRINAQGELEHIKKTDLVISTELAVCADFDMFNERFYSPASGFRKKRWCIIQTDDGQMSINGSRFFFLSDSRLSTEKINSPEARREIMEEYFGLVFTDEEWDVIASHTELG